MESAASHPATHPKHRGSDSLTKKILMILLIVLAIMLIISLALKIFLVRPTSHDIKSKQYQALFLTNGQVYFGKLSRVDNSYLKLTDIYYLQSQTAQPGPSPAPTATNNQPALSLAKLGNELHGPDDSMYVSKSQVLFWENLKDSGKVVQAIQGYQATKK